MTDKLVYDMSAAASTASPSALDRQTPQSASNVEKAPRMPHDFIAKKILEKDSNNFVVFALLLALSMILLVGAHFLHGAFFAEGGYLHEVYPNIEAYGDRDVYIESHWTSPLAFFGHWLCLIGSLVAWCTAWWQLGNVNALLAGLVVALVGYWAIGLFNGVYFGSGTNVVSLSEILPVRALQQFALGVGLGLAGVSLWSYNYKSVVSMWFAYAGSVLILLTGFFAVASAI